MSLPMGKSRRCRLRESKRWQELEGKLWQSFKFAYKSQHHTPRISPTPDPKEREEGFVRCERPRHHTIQRENVLYSRKFVQFRVKNSFFGPENRWDDS
jgi:hypothetical protein